MLTKQKRGLPFYKETSFLLNIIFFVHLFREDVAQLVRVLACHAKSRGFKSRRSRLDHLFKGRLTYLIVILLCLIQELTI